MNELPLSFGQERLWVLDQLRPGNRAYHLCQAFRIDSFIPPEVAQRLLDEIIARHEVLRTTFRFRDGNPVQVVHPPGQSVLMFHDLRSLPVLRREDALSGLIQEEISHPFDLSRGPLLRVLLIRLQERQTALVLHAHHIVFDGWSVEVVLREILALFGALSVGGASPLPELPLQYRDYAARQRRELQGDRLQFLKAYWKRKLGGVPVLELPLFKGRPAIRSFEGALYTFQVPGELYAALGSLSRSEGTTLFVTLLAAWMVLLSRYCCQEDVSVRTPVSSRNQAGTEHLVGFFVNTLVMRVDLSGAPSFRELLSRVRQVVLEGIEYQDLPFELLVREFREPNQDLSRPALAQHGFVYNRVSSQIGLRSLGFDIHSLDVNPGTSQLDMTVFAQASDGLSFSFEYRTDLFDRAFVLQVAGHFENLLREVVGNPDRKIGQLGLLRPEERRELVGNQGRGRGTNPSHRCVHLAFEDQVRFAANSTAVEMGERRLSFEKLNKRANRLAHYLISQVSARNPRIAICLDRSPEFVVAMLAALKAGGAFVPLDPSYPIARLRSIVEDCKPEFLLTVGKRLNKEWEPVEALGNGSRICRLDQLETELLCQPPDNPSLPTSLEDLAYVIYTSGSTGRPKGVEISHRALTNHMDWMQRVFAFGNQDAVLQRTPVGFDASIWEFLAPLLSGGRLVLVPSGREADLDLLVESIQEASITTLQMVPTLLQLLLERGGLRECHSLKRVFSGGEVLTPALVEKFFRQATAQLFNLYGPTEACIDVTWHECRPEDARKPVPLGNAIDNVQVLVLDSQLEPVPMGVQGELCIAGRCLARGYVNLPELNQQRFVPNPFGVSGERMFRSGDMARFLPDGSLEFLGRLDRQVKINGIRTEPAEIEAAMNLHPAVKESAVLPCSSAAGTARLAAYFVSGEAVSSADLREFLRRRLPTGMIPSYFIRLETLPRQTAGKVDYEALPPVESHRPPAQVEFREPRNEIEARLARIWAEVLGLERVGIDDDFFELGGASLQTIQVIALASREELSFPPDAIFRYPTVADLAQALGDSTVAELGSPECSGLDAPEGTELARELVSLEAGAVTPRGGRSKIESIGVYLPPKEVTTEEILDGCRNRVRLPLRRLTGIETRRMAGEDEFSFDLARQAVSRCLENSKYSPGDIDLLISCNIGRCDGPSRFSFEPTTAVKLKAHFGFESAVSFDLTNACAGMFTGVLIADELIRRGDCRRAIVVSGEYITHLTQAAQFEIESFLDTRLACLTLGDAGAAVLLDRCEDWTQGFQYIDLFTLGSLSSLCVAKAANGGQGRPIMHTDMVKVSETATRHAMIHAAMTLKNAGAVLEELDYFITHQTSRNALRGAATEINRLLGYEVCRQENLLDNIANRGNTASTSHFVLLWDQILSRRIRSGRKALFSITGSGQTIGTALYSLDEFPDRLREIESGAKPVAKVEASEPPPSVRVFSAERIRIECVGLSAESGGDRKGAVQMAVEAAENCLSASSAQRQELSVLIHCGIYRDDFMVEPALGAFVAGELGANAVMDPIDGPRTLAFDLYNGPLGPLNACYVASQLMLGKGAPAGMVVASEFENNAELEGCELLGLREMGSALLLKPSGGGGAGFGAFLFRDFPEFVSAYETSAVNEQGFFHLVRSKRPELEKTYLNCILPVARELLESQQVDPGAVNVVLPPLFSDPFLDSLAKGLNVDRRLFPRLSEEGGLYYTSALAAGFDAVIREERGRLGEVGLIIGVGPGVQVGCALYYY